MTPSEGGAVESLRFDRLVITFATEGTRRGLIRILSLVPLVGALANLLDEEGEAGRRQHRRQGRHHPGKHKKHRKGKRRGPRRCAKFGQKVKRHRRRPCCKGLIKNSARRCVQCLTTAQCAVQPNTICEDGSCQPCDVCTSGCAFTSVQAAIDFNAPQLQTIRVCAGAYTEFLTLERGLTLIGAGEEADANSNTILQGIGKVPGGNTVVTISNIPQSVTLQSLRITAGYGNGGGIWNQGASVRIADCTVFANAAPGGGGGINNASGSMVMNNCTVSGNTNADDGGGINNTGELTVTNSTITDNTANFGGALFNGGGGNATFTDCDLTGNTANNDGGAIFVFSGTATVNTSNVSNNTPNNCAPMGTVSGCVG